FSRDWSSDVCSSDLQDFRGPTGWGRYACLRELLQRQDVQCDQRSSARCRVRRSGLSHYGWVSDQVRNAQWLFSPFRYVPAAWLSAPPGWSGRCQTVSGCCHRQFQWRGLRAKVSCADLIAQIVLAYFGVVANFVWGARGDDSARYQYRDAIGQLEHGLHVVLDEQYRQFFAK